MYFSAYDQASRTCTLAYDLQAGELAVEQRMAVVGVSGSEVCGVGTVAGFDMAANTVTLAEGVLGAGGDGVDGYLVWAAGGQGAQAMAAGQGCIAAATNAVALGGWNTVLAQNALAAGIYNLVEAAGNARAALDAGNRVTNSEAVATGNQCLASGSAARAHGESCTASGSAAVAEGMGSEAAGSGSRALGLYARTRLAGQSAMAQGRFVTAGDAQEAVYRMAIATSNATPAELRIAGAGRLVIDAGRTLSCLVNVVARSSTGESASFLRRVVVKNVAGVVSLVGGVETVGWIRRMPARRRGRWPSRQMMAVRCRGAIRWHAVVQRSEVVY